MTAAAWLVLPLSMLAGWSLWTRLPPAPAEAEDRFERLFAVAICSVVITGVLALLLAEIGYLRPWLLVGSLGVLSSALLLCPRRQAGPPPSEDSRGTAAAVLAVTVLGVATMAPASEDVLGGRDPGVYANTAAWVAQQGTLRVHWAPLAEVAPEGRGTFYRGNLFAGFYVRNAVEGEISPQFLHLQPLYMAIGHWMLGPRGVFLAAPLLAVLAELALFFFVRRLLGLVPALVAVCVVALNLAQVWGGRNPYSEIATQLGVLAALWSMAAAAQTTGLRWGVLGGLSLGLCFLSRIDAALLLAALAPALALAHATAAQPMRWATHALLPITVLFACWSMVHAWLFSWPYLRALSRRVVPLWSLTTAVMVLSVAGFRFRPPVRRWMDAVHRHGWHIWVTVGLVLCALFVVGMWVRPDIESLVVYRGASRNYAEQALVRFAWYFSIPGLVFALGGVLVVLHQWLVERRTEWLPFLALFLAFSLLYFWNPRIHFDHPWMMRRFLPVVVPGVGVVVAAAAWFLWSVHGRWRTTARTLAVLGPAIILAHEAAMVRPFLWLREKAGLIEQLDRFATELPDRGIVLHYVRGTEQRVAVPLAFYWNRAVLPLVRDRRDSDGEQRREHFESQLTRWLEEGREVHYLTTEGADAIFLPHRIRWEKAAELTLDFPTFGSSVDRAPRAPQRHLERFQLLRAVPALRHVNPCDGLSLDMGDPLAGMAQGLYAPETAHGERFRWTMPRARVMLPACDATGLTNPVLRIRAACWREADCTVAVIVNGSPVETVVLSRRFASHELPLESMALVNPIAPIEVAFHGPQFVPAESGLGRDKRVLSFQLSRVELLNAAVGRVP